MSATDVAIERWTKPENNTLSQAYRALAAAEATLSAITYSGKPIMEEIERRQRELDGMKAKVAAAIQTVDMRRTALEAAIMQKQAVPPAPPAPARPKWPPTETI